jgi:hypothetical protein
MAVPPPPGRTAEAHLEESLKRLRAAVVTTLLPGGGKRLPAADMMERLRHMQPRELLAEEELRHTGVTGRIRVAFRRLWRKLRREN